MTSWTGRLPKLNLPMKRFTMTFTSLIEFYEPFQDRMLNQHNVYLTSQEWIGLYRSTDDALHEWVVKIGYLKKFCSGLVQFSVEFISIFPRPIVRSQYFISTKVNWNFETVKPTMAFSWWMAHVRVNSLTRGSSQTQFNLFFERCDQIFFDFARLWWHVTPFFLIGQRGEEMDH